MTLTAMRFKDYIWPHNPRTYEIQFLRRMAVHPVPGGRYTLQNMGISYRVLRGEGEFTGEGAYDEFKKLATVFYEDSAGILIHPVWQSTKAYFVSLSLKQEPKADYVSYAFEFWECYEDYSEELTALAEEEETAPETEDEAEERYVTAVSGDTLWGIAVNNGLTLSALLALNPSVKNPNILYVGDKIRVK